MGELTWIPPPVNSSGWQHASGLFSYAAGSPTGTIPAAGVGAPLTLTFQVRP